MAFDKAGRYNELLFINGKLAPNVDVIIYLAGTSIPATLYSDRLKTASLANSIVRSDLSGNLTFYADPGYYDIEINGIKYLNITVDVDYEEVNADLVAHNISERAHNLPINVKSYGAIGNGIADDTVAIQAALTAAGIAGGGKVFLPDGTYIVTSILTIPTDNIHFFGVGALSLLSRPAATGAGLVMLKADSRTNVAVYDIALNAGGNDFNGEGAIFFRRCVTSTVERCVITNTGPLTPAISFDSPTACKAKDNVINGTGYGIVLGTPSAEINETNDNIISSNIIRNTIKDSIFVTASLSSVATATKARRNTIINNVISGCGDAGIEAGIGTVNTLIVGNEVRGSAGPNIVLRDSVEFIVSLNICTDSTNVVSSYGGGIVVADQISTFASSKGTISNNRCHRNTGCGINIATNSIYVGRHFVVSDNHCEANTQHGISSLQNIASAFTGNVCIGNTLNGINIEAVSADGRGNNSVTGNVCGNNSGTGGIVLSGEYSIITGNRCYDDQGVKTQDYGINLFNTQANFCTVMGNELTGNLTAAINDAGTGNIRFNNHGANANLVSETGAFELTVPAALVVGDKLKVVGHVGFYNTFPIAKQTAVPVTAAGIHAALVALGLIT